MKWKNQFINNYFSKDKVQNGIELKNSNIPSNFYRYRSIATQANLNHLLYDIYNSKLFLSNPKNFNDPFDVFSMLNDNTIKEFSGLKKLDDLYERFVRSNFYHNNLNLYDFLDFLVDESLVVNKHNDIMVMENSKSTIEDFNAMFNKSLQSSIRIACFSEKYDNLPMWYHYANAHEGVCLEYKIFMEDNAELIDRMMPVIYTAKNPNVLEAFKELRDMQISDDRFLLYLSLHKLIDWEYEQEWRLVYFLSEWYKTYEETPIEYREGGIIIDFIKPSKIILGYRMGEATERLFKDIGNMLNIHVVKMKCTNYGLKLEDEF